MALHRILKQKVPVKSQLARDLKCVKGWTKHHPMMVDPIEGVACEDGEVWKILDNPVLIAEIYKDLTKCEFVIKKLNGVWYMVPESNLTELRMNKANSKLKHYRGITSNESN